MNIREAVIYDANAIANLSCQLGYPSSEADSERRLSAILQADDHSVFVACSPTGIVVGWIHAYLVYRVESNRFAELGGFVVSGKHRRMGIGSKLLASAEKWSKDHGLTKLRVRSRIERDEARLFFENLGFSKAKEQRVFDKSLEDNT